MKAKVKARANLKMEFGKLFAHLKFIGEALQDEIYERPLFQKTLKFVEPINLKVTEILIPRLKTAKTFMEVSKGEIRSLKNKYNEEPKVVLNEIFNHACSFAKEKWDSKNKHKRSQPKNQNSTNAPKHNSPRNSP